MCAQRGTGPSIPAVPLFGPTANPCRLLAAPALQLLAAHSGRLGEVPAAFTAARKADADALLWLDRSAHAR